MREEDEARTFFSLPTLICPIKVSILPLSNKSEFDPFITKLGNSWIFQIYSVNNVFNFILQRKNLLEKISV